MKHVQVKIFREGSAVDMEMKANEFLRDIPSHEVIHTGYREGFLFIVYRETAV